MDLNWIFDILLFLPIIGYWCWHNVHDYDDFCACVAAIGGNDATIFVPNEQAINKDCTVPNNIMLQIIKGGSLNVGKFSIRNATYQWIQSGVDGDEYYLQLAGGGNPGLSDPLKVYENGVLMDIGVLGGLVEGEWVWGDNGGEATGNTVYVRIAGTVNPDTKADDYVEAGYVVTINGWVEAGAYQIFEGDGSVVLGPLAAAAMFPEWYTG